MTEEEMEKIAWEWLEKAVSDGSGEHPNDIDYSADWVIDAFIAGMQRAAGGAA